MTRPLEKRCPQCGSRKKDLAKHLARCVGERRKARAVPRHPWANPVAPSGRATINRYVCTKCAHAVVTRDAHEGTTPFLIRCDRPGCGEMMRSSFYQCDQTLAPTHEWRAPTLAEYRRAHPLMRDHFDQGGLDMHVIAAVSP